MNGEHLFWLAFWVSFLIIIFSVIYQMKKCERCGASNAANRPGQDEFLCIGCWNKVLGKRPKNYRKKNTDRLIKRLLRND